MYRDVWNIYVNKQIFKISDATFNNFWSSFWLSTLIDGQNSLQCRGIVDMLSLMFLAGSRPHKAVLEQNSIHIHEMVPLTK